MPAPRSSAQRKFARGVEQVKRLSAEADGFEDRNAYLFRAEVHSRSPHKIEYRCFAVEQEPPPDEWPLLAGKAIQNLRSALDHLVYAASRGRSGTQFPIFTDPGRFEAEKARMLPGVPATVRAAIENAQPYRTAPRAPGRAMLEQLRWLSNLDKHRTLATVASAVQHEGVGVPKGVGINWQKYATNQPLGSGETHVSTFTASSESELGDVDLEPMFAYEVRIEGRRLSLLTSIIQEAYRVLVECETGKPLSPFATYPL